MKWITTILILCAAVLTGLGMVMLYSASMSVDVGRSAAGAHFLDSQLVWLLCGLVGCIAMACADYRKLKKWSPWLMGVSVVLLALVYVPHIGIGSHGARRWIGRPGTPHFQPSELAKLALIIFLAAYAEWQHRRMAEFLKGLVYPGFVVAVTLGLIFREPDRGCTILLGTVSGAMLVLGGVRLIYFVPPALAGAAAMVVSILHDPMRMKRVMAWLHPELAKTGAGYQVWQAMIALGSGGLTGLGLGNSRQKLGFVPEQYTDCIFSIIGEELGLVTTLLVIFLYLALMWCGFAIARRASDLFGALLASGITLMIGLQAFINIGVVTCVLPNKGMPLPFISYGGSNLLLMLVAIGLLLSIARFSVPAPSHAPAHSLATSPELTNA